MVSRRARWRLMSNPNSLRMTFAASGKSRFPSVAMVPADPTSISASPGCSCARCRKTASAIGLRQMLPAQTNSTRLICAMVDRRLHDEA